MGCHSTYFKYDFLKEEETDEAFSTYFAELYFCHAFLYA